MIVLTLTAVPCCALEDSRVHPHEQSANEQKDQKENKSAEKEDGCCKDCSPFYVCGTCVGFTISSYSLLAFTAYLKPIQHGSIFLTAEIIQTTSTIWQPPKLS